VLFDSEKGTPRTRFGAGSTWLRAPNQSVFPPVPANATSGRRSWYSTEPDGITASSLTMHPVALPAGRRAYLWFEQWRVLESGSFPDGTPVNYDGGTVEVADATRGSGPRHAERRPWVNGPHDVLSSQFGNPAADRPAFSRDSHGYLASRLSLKRNAGHAVRPQFTMNTDSVNAGLGWYLDDIRIYTCSRGPVPRTTPRITGTPTVGSRLTAHGGHWSPSRVKRHFHWFAGGRPIAGATGKTYVARPADVGKRITVKVTVKARPHPGHHHHRHRPRHASTFSVATAPVTEL
jgi:hypothetical protein